MDDMLKTRLEKEAGVALMDVLRYTLATTGRGMSDKDKEELRSFVDEFVHTLIEAAAEKGRGQIR